MLTTFRLPIQLTALQSDEERLRREKEELRQWEELEARKKADEADRLRREEEEKKRAELEAKAKVLAPPPSSPPPPTFSIPLENFCKISTNLFRFHYHTHAHVCTGGC